MSEIVGEFTISVEQVEGYRFQADFDRPGLPPLVMDEPPPLGTDTGPNPARVLGAALGGCLSMSLLFCLTKSRVRVEKIGAKVTVQMVRNEQRRLRVGKAVVTLEVEMPEDDRPRAKRCLGLFEDFCTVTASVRQGLDVEVRVEGI